ncbi:MAG TPA: alpha/beta family hydrolase [Candidatus Saccharimonadales bacterium]|nr:alpha/beta family hydrolase [Candidatus Saccharimonadales bacterium]
MRERSLRVPGPVGDLEATLRIPDGPPRAIVVIAHPLPTHGGTMRNPLVAAVARACADQDLYALRFNFRGVGSSAGEWTGGTAEVDDLAAAVAHAHAAAPGLPLAVAGYSFGAITTLRWVAGGGSPAALALAGLPLRSVSFAPQELPPVPDGTFIVAAEHDQFGTADELRLAYPRAVIAEVAGVDHFFPRRHAEVGTLIAAHLVRGLGLGVTGPQ